MLLIQEVTERQSAIEAVFRQLVHERLSSIPFLFNVLVYKKFRLFRLFNLFKATKSKPALLTILKPILNFADYPAVLLFRR